MDLKLWIKNDTKIKTQCKINSPISNILTHQVPDDLK